MCILAKPVRVFGTKIFVSPTSDGRQFIIYQNTLNQSRNREKGNAMILPVPLLFGGGGDEGRECDEKMVEQIEFVDMRGYKEIFFDLKNTFRRLLYGFEILVNFFVWLFAFLLCPILCLIDLRKLGSACSSSSEAAPRRIQVTHKSVGSYDIALCPTLDLLKEETEIPLNVEQLLQQKYPSHFVFVVAKVSDDTWEANKAKDGSWTPEPLGYIHPLLGKEHLKLIQSHQHQHQQQLFVKKEEGRVSDDRELLISKKEEGIAAITTTVTPTIDTKKEEDQVEFVVEMEINENEEKEEENENESDENESDENEKKEEAEQGRGGTQSPTIPPSNHNMMRMTTQEGEGAVVQSSSSGHLFVPTMHEHNGGDHGYHDAPLWDHDIYSLCCVSPEEGGGGGGGGAIPPIEPFGILDFQKLQKLGVNLPSSDNDFLPLLRAFSRFGHFSNQDIVLSFNLENLKNRKHPDEQWKTFCRIVGCGVTHWRPLSPVGAFEKGACSTTVACCCLIDDFSYLSPPNYCSCFTPDLEGEGPKLEIILVD